MCHQHARQEPRDIDWPFQDTLNRSPSTTSAANLPHISTTTTEVEDKESATTTQGPNEHRDQSNDFCQLLQTRSDGVNYTVFRRNKFECTGTVDHSIITFCMSTLEYIRRMRKNKEDWFPEFPFVSAQFATDGVHDCVQIVAKKNECSTSRFLCWAEDGELVTGTAIVHRSCEKFPFKDFTTSHGDFQKTMQGKITPHYHLFAYAQDAGIARFWMVIVPIRHQLALFSVDSIQKPVV